MEKQKIKVIIADADDIRGFGSWSLLFPSGTFECVTRHHDLVEIAMAVMLHPDAIVIWHKSMGGVKKLKDEVRKFSSQKKTAPLNVFVWFGAQACDDWLLNLNRFIANHS